MIQRILHLAALTGLIILFAASNAFAACDNHAPANGATVTCSGSDSTEINGSNSTGVTINYLAGSTSTSLTDSMVAWIGSGTININNGASVAATISDDGGALTLGFTAAGSTLNIASGASLTGKSTAFEIQDGTVNLDGSVVGAGIAVRSTINLSSTGTFTILDGDLGSSV